MAKQSVSYSIFGDTQKIPSMSEKFIPIRPCLRENVWELVFPGPEIVSRVVFSGTMRAEVGLKHMHEHNYRENWKIFCR